MRQPEGEHPRDRRVFDSTEIGGGDDGLAVQWRLLELAHREVLAQGAVRAAAVVLEIERFRDAHVVLLR
ncbi:hypothetical protein ACH61_02339 [Rathayibacter tanaceti]|uniref:Uncharacterized protein n=1 Tax=Rathayibacter tanaceti TaxID=1671680 RepID=A0A166HG57_9MICO|nr:hypothetical protein ACH61_02339 [Rathayibacter tanaceti]